MKMIYCVSILIGICGILQAGLNKQVALELGLGHTILICMTIPFLMSLGLYFLLLKNPQLFPSLFAIKKSLHYFRWWYLVPGCLGFFIILMLPKTIAELGALKVTILIIAGQIFASGFWDYWIEGRSFSGFKFLGMVLAMMSVVFSML